MKYSHKERAKILADAREMLLRLRAIEAIDGLEREAEDDRGFQQLQEARRRWLAHALETRQQSYPRAGLVYKVKHNARIR